MIDQINVLYYPTSKGLVDDLINRLNRGEMRARSLELNANNPLRPGLFQRDAYFNVIIIQPEDTVALKNVDWSSIPRLNSISKDKRLSVAFCINCSEMVPQLRDCFLVKESIDSAEQIRREIIQLQSLIFQTLRGRYGFFVGRNNEIEQFQNILYSEKVSRLTALIVSGRSGVGREAFVRNCIRQSKGERDYEPFTLSMGKSGSVELFLIQLNSILCSYSNNDFINLLGRGANEKVVAAVEMLNDLFRGDNYLILYDDGASCVRYDRKLSEWFRTVVTHPMLKGGMHLYVISNIAVSYSRIKIEDDVAFITLYGLTLSDRKKLLYKQLSTFSEAIPEDVIQELAEKLVYSPSQLMNVAEDVHKKDVNFVRKNISDYQRVGDKKILSLVNSYNSPDHPEAKNVLVLLSRIEYVDKKLFQSIFLNSYEEVEQEIDRFMADGIVERFGEWMELTRLDSSISDFIRRNKIGYTDKAIELLVDDKLEEVIEDTNSLSEGYSAYLIKLKKVTQTCRFTKDSFLVPSVLVNTIAETYDNKDWGVAIKLCEDVFEKKTDYFEEVYREINYWYCLALARKQNGDKFYPQVKYFTGADYYFLKGFYLRIQKHYAEAENEYRKALNINSSFSRVKREMVLVLQAQHKFMEALQMAEQNYEKDPENAYHIHAYFRCLVRKRDITYDEKSLLLQFITDKDNLFKSKFYIEGMKFEYMRFVDRARPDILLPIASELDRKYKDKAYIKDVVNDYYVSQGLKAHLETTDFSDDFNF